MRKRPSVSNYEFCQVRAGVYIKHGCFLLKLRPGFTYDTCVMQAVLILLQVEIYDASTKWIYYSAYFLANIVLYVNMKVLDPLLITHFVSRVKAQRIYRTFRRGNFRKQKASSIFYYFHLLGRVCLIVYPSYKDSITNTHYYLRKWKLESFGPAVH